MCKYPKQRCFYRISTEDLVLISLCSLPLRSLTFLYSCLWMTTACARLYPLTLVWPDAWRFSTNSQSAYVLSCICPSPVILSFSGRCAHAFVLRVFAPFISFHRAQSNRCLWEGSVWHFCLFCVAAVVKWPSVICFVACYFTFHFLCYTVHKVKQVSDPRFFQLFDWLYCWAFSVFCLSILFRQTFLVE